MQAFIRLLRNTALNVAAVGIAAKSAIAYDAEYVWSDDALGKHAIPQGGAFQTQS